MFWLITAIILLLFFGWIVFSPFELEIDTGVPHASFKWLSIGKAEVVFVNENWILSVDSLFYRRQWPLSRIFRKTGKTKKEKAETTGKSKYRMPLPRILAILSSFRIKEWRLALDANEGIPVTMAYPLNFFPVLSRHVLINFKGRNYFRIRISNRIWRLAFAWIK